MSKQPAYNPCLDTVAEAIVADDREQAGNLVRSTFNKSNTPVEAWLVKAWTSDSLRDAEASIQKALQLDPANELASAGMNWILGIQEIAEAQLEIKRCDEEQKRHEAEEQARLEAEEKARHEAEEQARLEAEEDARLKAEEKTRQDEAAAKALREVEERQQLEAEEKARQEAQKQARIEAEEREQTDTEEQERIQAEYALWKAKQARLENQKKQQRKIDELDIPEEPSSPKEDAFSETEPAVKLLDEVNSLAEEINKPGTSADDTDSIPSGSQNNNNQNGVKAVVLAVDDSPTVRKLVSLTLTQEGYEVIEAENGVEALNILGHQLPDIILSDINMPKLNGYKLCKFVKKHDRTKNIPVVMLSGKDGVFDKMRGKLSGCDDFISKPFESVALVEKVRQHLKSSSVNA